MNTYISFLSRKTILAWSPYCWCFSDKSWHHQWKEKLECQEKALPTCLQPLIHLSVLKTPFTKHYLAIRIFPIQHSSSNVSEIWLQQYFVVTGDKVEQQKNHHEYDKVVFMTDPSPLEEHSSLHIEASAKKLEDSIWFFEVECHLSYHTHLRVKRCHDRRLMRMVACILSACTIVSCLS